MTTLKEIARAAGVSATTVSNVINGNHRRVSAETVETIRRLIRESGYIPNQVARSLAQRGSRFVAIVVQAAEDENAFLNPYNAAYVGALSNCLYKHGYYPLLRFTDDFHAVENDLRGWNVSGALFNGSFNHRLQQIESLAPIPCVFTDCYFELPGVSHVRLDDEAGGHIAGDYLADMGHRRMAFVGTELTLSDVDKRRLTGFRQSLSAHGIDLPEAWILPNADFDGQRDRLDALIGDPGGPTAFFCCADITAIALIRQITARGRRVPDDISVLGFDDLPLASLASPRLTTIGQDLDQKAALAVDMLMRHIGDKALSPERTVLGVSLVERESVARI